MKTLTKVLPKKLVRFAQVMFNESIAYHLFNFLPFNRDVDNAHVKSLMESMEKNGFKGVIQVIKTTFIDGVMKLYIVDGQHRFVAASRLKIPFRFEVTELKTRLETVRFIAELNNSQKKWGTSQYLNVWAGLNIPEYTKFNNIYETTGFQITPLIEAYTFSGRMIEFRKGEMKFPNETESDKIIQQLLDLNQYLPKKAFCRRAIVKLMRQKKYKHPQMKKAVNQYHQVTGGFSENEMELTSEFQRLIDVNC